MLRRLLARSDFARNALTLMTGATVAQIIPLVISPILTRLYTPSDFALLALYTSVAGLVATSATGTYEQAVMLPKDDEDAFHVVVLSLIVALAVSASMLLVVSLLHDWLVRILRNPEISPWLYLTPLTVFLTGAYQTFSFWSNRQKRYRHIATSRIVQACVAAAVNLGMGIAGLGASGLVAGSLSGQGIAAGLLGWLSRIGGKDRRALLSKAKMLEQARKYRDFPRFTMVHTFLDGLRDSAMVFLLSHFFASPVLGFYAFSLRILKMPLTLMGAAMAQVFYQRAASEHNLGRPLWPLLRSMLLRLLLIALPIWAGIIALGPALFPIVFGREWREAGVYAQLLSPWIFVNFLVSPISQIPLVLSKQKTFLMIGVGYNAIVPASLLMAAAAGADARLTLGCASIAAGGYLVGILLWIIRISREAGGSEA